MNSIDYALIAGYLIGLLAIGFLWRTQSTEEDYFLGGKSMGWFPLTLSTMATQLSAISFISAPAFVGMREGGGLQWLAYEFAVPLAMLLVAFVILPALYRSGVVSIYDFLEKRFDRSTRFIVSFVFQIVRSFGTGIAVYAICIILQAMFDMSLMTSLITVGIITLIYSTSGGMKAVVYGDVVQMVLIFIGVLLVAGFAVAELGSADFFWENVESDRFNAVITESFGFSGDQFGFLPMLFGGFVLYASYYGCDQTQAQRAMSAKNEGDIKKLLVANGLLRFPLVLLYCITGLIVGVVVKTNPELLAQVPADKPDYMMPVFILAHMPNGVIGILVVAILSAAMSSLSSTVNSLAAVSIEDLTAMGIIKHNDEGRMVIYARWISLFWGLVILVLSFYAGSIAPTVIEAINKVGSALYGPTLGVFLLAIFRNRTTATGVNIGLIVGMLFNLYLWLFQPQVFWMWWNFIGLVITVGIAYLVSFVIMANHDSKLMNSETLAFSKKELLVTGGLLCGFFVLIVVLSHFIGSVGKGMLL